MQAITNILSFINNYIGYLYVVIFIVVMVMIVQLLLAMIRLSHSATDFDMAVRSINASYKNLKNYKKRTSSFLSKTLRVIAAYQLSRIYLSHEKRAELRKEKDDITLSAKRDKYVKNLLKD